jgi:hypothetical protein
LSTKPSKNLSSPTRVPNSLSISLILSPNNIW